MMDNDVFRKLGITDAMIRHLTSGNVDRPFGYRCQPAFHWRSSPIAERGILALWECGIVLSYFNPANSCFERCSLENIEEVWCRHRSIQGLLAELFLDAFEDEIEDFVLEKYAKLFGFRGIDRMLNEVKTVGRDYSLWRQQFPSSCGGM